MNHIKPIFLVFVLSLYSINGACAETDWRTIKLDVSGMSSPACPQILISAVRQLEGVKTVNASLEQHSAIIEFDASRTDLKNIQDIIYRQAGFSTRAAVKQP